MSGSTSPVRFVRAGDSAIVVEFEERIDLAINARCIAVANAVRASGLPGVRDVVPAYRAVTVYFDPLRTELTPLVEYLKRCAGAAPHDVESPARTHRVPVCYGGEFGPDLAEVAAFGGLSEDETVARHAGRLYRVFMLGFIPGFAYLGAVDQQIAAPRRETPRARVAAGSVGIASAQTGIYPMDTPGGWQLIGRSPMRIFDPSRDRPSLFQPGDAVHFFPISRHEWDRFSS
jgi:inhibitor of KinA